MEADLPAGRAWMQRAADAGMIEAQVFLAEITVHGRGGTRDHAAALKLFQAAAAKDHTGAQFAVGALLGGGHDVPIDLVAAQEMFSKAAAKAICAPCSCWAATSPAASPERSIRCVRAKR